MLNLPPGIGDRGLELLPDHVRLVDQPHHSLLGAERRRHRALGLLEVLDPGSLLRKDPFRDLEGLAEPAVEALGDVPRELDVLPLVVADRNHVGLVQQDVACHQHGVREEPARDEIVPLGLVLELRHPAELPEARHRAQQPGRLGVSGHAALGEDGRALGIEAGGEEHRGEVERSLAQVGGVVLDGDRVEVDDAEERVAELLGRGVLAEAAAVVAEVLGAGRLDAGEDPHRAGIIAAAPMAACSVST